MYNCVDKNIFILFQINDALFPIGAYSHSYGLETYIQKNLIKDMDSAYEYLKSNLMSNFLYSELLSIYLAYEYAEILIIISFVICLASTFIVNGTTIQNNTKRIIEIDNILNNSKSSKEVRIASQKLGSRFIKTLISTNVKYKNDNFINYVKSSENLLSTHTVSYGVFCQSIGIPKDKAIEGFLYSYTSQTITNCVKTIPLSQTDGQRLLYKSYEIFEEVLNILPKLTIDDLCLSTPGFDIRSMQHETLYSRLYMS